MTSEQIVAQAQVVILIQQQKEALMRELHALTAAHSLSPRLYRITEQLDAANNALIAVFDRLSVPDARAVNRLVWAAIPDQWFDIRNALPPSGEDATRQ